ncbi:trypsin, alkaline C-like [Anticarsia gemmatalis]|uniref:trypsin, alkaline C-like n=1 Tax=Anticarsia gemmatalis TaxID=129554 RepID=UPI003F75B099
MVSAVTLALVLFAGFCTAEHYAGTPATIEQYPSLVQIEMGAGPLWFQYCVGSVLTNVHILSAARCFVGPLGNPRSRRVRAGATFRGRDGAIFRIQSITSHPSFLTNIFDGDIAVVRLSSALTFGSTIQQASIVAQDVIIPANLPVVHAGWGATAQNDALWADRELHTINAFTITPEVCSERFDGSWILPFRITTNMICSGLAPEGLTFGVRDAGGPIYYDDIVVGVISFGSHFNKSIPLVATRVSAYTDWVVAQAV